MKCSRGVGGGSTFRWSNQYAPATYRSVRSNGTSRDKTSEHSLKRMQPCALWSSGFCASPTRIDNQLEEVPATPDPPRTSGIAPDQPFNLLESGRSKNQVAK